MNLFCPWTLHFDSVNLINYPSFQLAYVLSFYTHFCLPSSGLVQWRNSEEQPVPHFGSKRNWSIPGTISVRHWPGNQAYNQIPLVSSLLWGLGLTVARFLVLRSGALPVTTSPSSTPIRWRCPSSSGSSIWLLESAYPSSTTCES